MDREADSWASWSRFVLAEMKRLNQHLDQIEEQIASLRNNQIAQLKLEIAMLKVKSGVWGIMGGAIPIGIYIFVEMLKK